MTPRPLWILIVVVPTLLASCQGVPSQVPATSSSATAVPDQSAPERTSSASETTLAAIDLPDWLTAGTDVDSVVHDDQAAFISPSGNITCLMSAAGRDESNRVRCDIAKSDYEVAPRPDTCEFDWGPGVQLSDHADFSCVSDAIWGTAVLEPDNPPSWFLTPYDDLKTIDGNATVVLGYGRSLSLGDMRCVSDESYVACMNITNGAGFEFSRTAANFAPPSWDRQAPRIAAGALTGEWRGHGRYMSVSQTGAIEASYRSYSDCADAATPPCDGVVGGGIVSGGYVIMQLRSLEATAAGVRGRALVVSSADPRYAVGSEQILELSAEIVTWDGGTYCGPTRPSECGA